MLRDFKKSSDKPKRPFADDPALRKPFADDFQTGISPLGGEEANVPPGGRPQIDEGTASGDRMQYSEEKGRVVDKSMVYVKHEKVL